MYGIWLGYFLGVIFLSMKNAGLVAKYILFALIAIAINLAMQYIALRLYVGIFSLYVAIFLGTIAGLCVKYLLDKKYIFYYQPQTRLHDFKKFISYAVTGVVTTIIFWGAELLFNALFDFGSAKFLGALIGLSLGYYIKYQLDKKFIFIKELQSH